MWGRDRGLWGRGEAVGHGAGFMGSRAGFLGWKTAVLGPGEGLGPPVLGRPGRLRARPCDVRRQSSARREVFGACGRLRRSYPHVPGQGLPLPPAEAPKPRGRRLTAVVSPQDPLQEPEGRPSPGGSGAGPGAAGPVGLSGGLALWGSRPYKYKAHTHRAMGSPAPQHNGETPCEGLQPHSAMWRPCCMGARPRRVMWGRPIRAPSPLG